jgi:hypothetical protein
VSSTVIGIAAIVAAFLFLLRRVLRERERRRHEPARFYARAAAVLEQSELQNTGAIGYPRLIGRYHGMPVQVLPIVDTLPLRRLPALWLLVTLQGALPVGARFDLMMRPTSPTSFSNFDQLPVTLQRPAGFPEHAVLRTDDAERVLPSRIVAPHVHVFEDPHAKELLITPNGVRLVWLIGEANRGRYGVFRDADFGDIDLDPKLLENLLDRLVALHRSILNEPQTV